MSFQTLIIGGGLSGLALAEILDTQGHDYLLLEARDRFGGRIMTEHHGAGYFDMGPAWFWPGQPRIEALLGRFALEKFDQYAEGAIIIEDQQGNVQRQRGFASMQGSWRLKGGLAALAHALADRLPQMRKRHNAQVKLLVQSGDRITATLTNGETYTANRVVLALPPRVAAELSFAPDLPATARNAMQDVATWMAGHAKAVAVYETPFWRDAGLSGDATSRAGPMVEVHDASPADGGPYALFGFIGLPPEHRSDLTILRQHLHAQFGRLFGPKAPEPLHLYVKDWALDHHTSTAADLAPLYAHPTYELPSALTGLWNDKLLFAGTEVAPKFGGYLEGALESAENVAKVLTVAARNSIHV